MHIRRIFLLALFVFVCSHLFAATLMVTSNADSGPGTLRQALLDAVANGTTTIDYINFNLPGGTQADITITLKSQLPDVTANVVIDGTTQPGAALGLSNAKIIITPLTPAHDFNAFNVSKLVGPNDAVEFYGLYIYGFSLNQGGFGNGITTNADCKLVLGAPGKGNVICGNEMALTGFFKNVIIQSNFIGIAPDGVTATPNFDNLYSNQDYGNLLIGGDDLVDGNLIGCAWRDGIDFEGSNAALQTVTVKNNLFGTDYTGTVSLRAAYNAFLQTKDAAIQLLVYNNVFSTQAVAINMMTKGALTVTGNFFGTDKTQTHQLGQGDVGISIVTDVIAVIGGDNPADQNVFAYYYNPIFADNDAHMLIIKNSFYCNDHVSVGNLISRSFVNITNLTDTNVSGDATPGSLIQLYYADESGCPNCNPAKWFANVTTDATGHWTYTGVTTGNILASSTVADNTFGFQRFEVFPSDVTIVSVDCHHLGSIKVNENRTGRIQFVWIDNATGKVVGKGREIDNLPAGVYNLHIDEGDNCTALADGQFTIGQRISGVFGQTFQLDCNHATASFTANVNLPFGFSVVAYHWLDAQGVEFSNNQSVNGLAAGTYYLYIDDSNGCATNKAKYIVLPPPAAPIIDDTKVVTTDADCSLSDGSITGLTISKGRNATYGWAKADGTELAPGQTDLKNAPPGQYYFFAVYNANCPPVKSRTFTINSKNGITFGASPPLIISATCANTNGSIKGLTAGGATKYQWFNEIGTLVDNSADLTDVGAGNYYMVASNAFCNEKSQTYTVGAIAAVSNFPATVITNDATCGLNNGAIAATFDQANAPASFRWTTAGGTSLIKDRPLTNVAPGNYDLYVTDNNDCESLYKEYTVTAIPALQIIAGSAGIIADQCSQKTGSIQGVKISGGVPPYTYNWADASGLSLSTTSDLAGIGAGNYTLQVKDATACGLAMQDYSVPNETASIDPPVADDVQLCAAGKTSISVNNPMPGYGYRLYGTSSSTTVLDDRPSGVFNISVSGSGSYFISKYIGECESPRVEVKVTVGLSITDIPNTFTPNNDGVNDLWIIDGVNKYPGVVVQLFDRYGQKVFESKGYSQPFDGKRDGKLLPPGVYYYIINLNSKCSLLSGSLTLIR